MRRVVLSLSLSLLVLPTRALAQEGDALCAMAASVESLSNTPGSLDSPLSTGRAGASPVTMHATIDPHESYVVLAAVDQGVPALVVTGCAHDLGAAETRGVRAALDFSGCNAATITVTLTVARGTRYALGLWRLDRARRNELGVRPQAMVVGGGGGGAFGGLGLGGPAPAPEHLPTCIHRRTERATPTRSTARAPSR